MKYIYIFNFNDNQAYFKIFVRVINVMEKKNLRYLCNANTKQQQKQKGKTKQEGITN